MADKVYQKDIRDELEKLDHNIERSNLLNKVLTAGIFIFTAFQLFTADQGYIMDRPSFIYITVIAMLSLALVTSFSNTFDTV